jgi:hypothetical protein
MNREYLVIRGTGRADDPYNVSLTTCPDWAMVGWLTDAEILVLDFKTKEVVYRQNDFRAAMWFFAAEREIDYKVHYYE